MRAKGEEEWLCDLAETYRIYDWTQFKPSYIAILSSGLRDDSRIKLKLAGLDVPLRDMILAKTADNTTLIYRGLFGIKDKPLLFADILNTKQKTEQGFDSVEEFEAARNKILRKGADING